MGKSTKMFFENKIKQFDHDLSVCLDSNDGDMRTHAEEVLNAEMIEKFKTFSKEMKVELLVFLFQKRFRRKWIFNEFRFLLSKPVSLTLLTGSSIAKTRLSQFGLSAPMMCE